MREELAHERHAGARIVVRHAPVTQRTSENRRVQRGIAERRRVRVGSLVEQQRRQRTVTAMRRDVQRGVAVGRRVVRTFSASGDQQADRFEVARPRGKQQRRATALGDIFERDAARRRSGRTAATHVVDPAPSPAAGADVRPVREKRPA